MQTFNSKNKKQLNEIKNTLFKVVVCDEDGTDESFFDINDLYEKFEELGF